MTDSLKIDTSPNSVESKIELSAKETRAILTPFAFKVDQRLFGISLAKPYKRAIALLIDLFLIAVLSDAPGELLAIVIAITLYRLGNKKHISPLTVQPQGKVKGRKRRILLRGFGFFIIFVVLVDTLPTLFNYFEPNANNTIITTASQEQEEAEGIKAHSFSSVVELMVIGYEVKSLTEESQCVNYQCWSKLLQKFVSKDLADDDLSLSVHDIEKIIHRAVLKTNLNEQEKQQLTIQLYAQYLTINAKRNQKNVVTKKGTKPITKQENKQKNDISEYSIIAWGKGIVNDLGLGFGWSAFYFTVLTALWRGQTLGKKVVGIKVLQLDGTPLTLWDSFGRYGGYGAGIATGLLGFLQIFWDANRQAIHDKISATVVIDTKNN